MSTSILVTGGAGYIGSHVTHKLFDIGYQPIVVDNLTTGFSAALPDKCLVVGDYGDRKLIEKLIKKHQIDTIMHFAANTVVSESVADPLRYYYNNAIKTHPLLETAVRMNIKEFILSSTAAVYGIPDPPCVSEDSPTNPINPYGASKLMTEWMLRDTAAIASLRYVTLRYFNVAGSDPTGRIGQSTPGATLLIKVACEASLGKRQFVSIFGTDYPTPDGTGIRDYIHVEDLSTAHLNALDYLRRGGESVTLNCGYGHGFSVREVLCAVQRVSGKRLDIREASRRSGDPPILIARADRIKEVLKWTPKHDSLESIIQSSLNWERSRRY